MENANSINSNFEIVDKEEYFDCIKINKGRYSIGRKALDASLYFNSLTDDELLINLGKDNVDDNSRKGFLTIRNINSILCFLFREDYKMNHNIDHVKRFLKNLEYHDQKMEDKIAFENFIELIRPHLSNDFREYNYILDHISWQFQVIKIDDEREKSIDKKDLISKNKESHHNSNNQTITKNESKKDESNLENIEGNILVNKRKTFNKWRSLTFLVVIVGLGSYITYIIQNYTESQNRLVEEKNIIEQAKSKSSIRSLELTNLLNEIQNEIKEDHLNDSSRNLSSVLISRIISLSEKFDPYLYLRDSKIITTPLSRERAELLMNLIELKLGYKTYDKIFEKANFSHSDFTNLDLSNYRLADLINGIGGSSYGDVHILITTTRRPNISYSNFDGTILINSDLYGDFTGSDFTKARINGTTFWYSKLSNSNFTGNKIVMTSFFSDFTNCNFRNSNLQSNFYETDLRGSIFDGSKISSVLNYKDLNEEKEHVDNPFKYRGYSPTFYNVFLSSADLTYNYDIKITRVNEPEADFSKFTVDYFEDFKNRGSESGLLILRASHQKSKSIKNVNEMIVAALRKKENKKDTIIFGVDFGIASPSDDFDNQYFMDVWKDNPDNFYSYSIRTNDHNRNNPIYFFPGEPYLDNEYEEIDYKLDTLHNFSGKDFHFISKEPLSRRKWHLCIPYKQKTKYTSASFKNCTFDNVHFYTKISDVSFEGSSFTESKFDYSSLYNVNFNNVKGKFHLIADMKFDSLYVDNDFRWIGYHKKTDSLLKQQYLINGKYISLKQFLVGKNIDSLRKFDVRNIKIWNSIEELRSIKEITNRIIIREDSKGLILRDRVYVNRYNNLKKLTHKNQDKEIPYH